MDIFIRNFVSYKPLFKLFCIFYTYVLLCNTVCVLARDCLGRDQCSCAFDDDQSLVALNSLGNSDGTPRFKDVTSDDGSTYSYNPCYPFSEGSGGCSQAAACETSLGETDSIGNAQPVQFTYTDGNVEVGYTAGSGILTSTQVKLVCDENACEPSFVAQGNQGLNLYVFTLTTVCACPNGCTEAGPVNCTPKSSGIGGGAVFLIVFFAFAFVYLVGGTVFLAFGRKARGKEMIPNVDFWTSLPGLIKDGVLFTLKPCLGNRSGYSSK